MGKDPGRCFKDFQACTGFTDTLKVFTELCQTLNIDPLQYETVYEQIKKGVPLQEVQLLFKNLILFLLTFDFKFWIGFGILFKLPCDLRFLFLEPFDF